MTDWLLQINRCQHCFRNGMEFHFCVSLTATTGSTGVELHWNCCTWIQDMSAHLPAACAPSRSRTRMFWSRFCLVMRIAFSSSGAASVPANSWQFLLGTWFKCQWQVKFTQASLVTHWAKSQHVLKISSRVWSPTLTSFHSIPWEGISAWWKTCTTPYVLLWPSCESQTAPSWNKSKACWLLQSDFSVLGTARIKWNFYWTNSIQWKLKPNWENLLNSSVEVETPRSVLTMQALMPSPAPCPSWLIDAVIRPWASRDLSTSLTLSDAHHNIFDALKEPNSDLLKLVPWHRSSSIRPNSVEEGHPPSPLVMWHFDWACCCNWLLMYTSQS